MIKTRKVLVAALVCQIAWVGSAQAQSGDDTSQSAETAGEEAIQARREDGTDQEARSLFQAGQVAFTEGRFANALEYFERSYELSRRPALLFNMGAAADRLRRDDEALEYFQQYLVELPDAPNRAEVEARVVVLQQAHVASTIEPADGRAAPPDAAPVDAAPHASGDPGPGPWIVLGAGVAAIVTGGVLVGFAVGDVASVENAPDGTRWESVRDAYDRSEPMSIGGVALIAVGAAATAGGLAWGLSGGGGEGDVSATLQLTPGDVLVRGTF